MNEYIGPIIFGLGLGALGLIAIILASKKNKKPVDKRSERQKNLDKINNLKSDS